jgi:hypothetical protein
VQIVNLLKPMRKIDPARFAARHFVTQNSVHPIKWRHAMRRFSSETRDGFQITQKQFTLPGNSRDLDPKTKRAVTICNLFLNQKLTVSDIIRVLDENYKSVVLALLEYGAIQDRRHHRGRSPFGTERRRFEGRDPQPRLSEAAP